MVNGCDEARWTWLPIWLILLACSLAAYSVDALHRGAFSHPILASCLLRTVRALLRPQLLVPVAQRQSLCDRPRPCMLSAAPRWRRGGGAGCKQETGGGELRVLLIWSALGRWNHSPSGNQEGNWILFLVVVVSISTVQLIPSSVNYCQRCYGPRMAKTLHE